MRLLTRIATAAFLFVAVSPAWAQESADVELDIAEQPLSTSLREVADNFDLTIAFYSESTDGLEAPALDGDFTSEAALETLLADTNLEYTFINDSSVAVRPAGVADQGGDSDPKNSSPAPILMAQNSSQSRMSTETTGRSDEGGASVIAGRVTDARTGANLRGAKVTIQETGQWTRTGDLGRFRFASVSQGEYTLSVSFLGYAGQSVTIEARGEVIAQDFALRGGSEIEEIVVFGQRSARALALNQERTARNLSTVVSSDFVGNSNGVSLADALRLAPGVAFVEDEERGTGRNIVIRGLPADLNTVTLNGVELPETTGTGRSADLDILLADSIDSVTINRTLLASQDSAGLGGLVEVTTKSPFDRPERFLQFSAQYGETAGDFAEEKQYGLVLSRTFDAGMPFGLSLTVSYRDENASTVAYSRGSLPSSFNLGAYYPEGISSLSQLDPRGSFPFEDGDERVFIRSSSFAGNSFDDETLNVSFTAEARPFAHTEFRADIQFNETDSVTARRRMNLSNFTRYTEREIAELGGDTRFGLVSSGTDGILTRNIDVIPNAKTDTAVVSLEGNTSLDKWSFSYRGGYTQGEQSTSERLDATFSSTAGFFAFDNYLSDAAIDPTEGIALTAFGDAGQPGFAYPLFNSDGVALLTDADFVRPSSINDLGPATGETDRHVVAMDVRRDLAFSNFRAIEFGALYESTEFRNFGGDGARVSIRASENISPGFLNNEFGFTFDDVNTIGGNGSFIVPNVDSFVAGARQIFSAAPTDDRLRLRQIDASQFSGQEFTKEDELAAYLQGEFEYGRLQMIAGLRVSQFDVEAKQTRSPSLSFPDPVTGDPVTDVEFSERETRLVSFAETVVEYLPRLAINFQVSDYFVVRGGYFRSFARPRVSQLSSDQTVSLDLNLRNGPDGNQPRLRVRQGNPGLEPAVTDNFDISFEWYTADAGALKLSAYYKEIDGLIEANDVTRIDSLDGISLPNDPRFLPENLPDNLLLEVSEPRNNPNESTIWGVEVFAEKQLVDLPDWWSGFGVFGSYNYVDSSKTVDRTWFNSPDGPLDYQIKDVPFFVSPEHTASLGILYNRHGLDAALTYVYQSEVEKDRADYGFRRIRDADERLDFRIDYTRKIGSADVTFFLKGSNLLDGSDDPAVIDLTAGPNVPTIYAGQTYTGGRWFSVGTRVVF